MRLIVVLLGKRLFRIWVCMPLREVKAINERQVGTCHSIQSALLTPNFSLDAVDDLMDNPTVENTFTSLAKSLPDLERIVSRIHAGSCKPKDFHRVLAVRKVVLCAQHG